MKGWFVQQRHYLARFAARYPRVTVVGITIRKFGWWLAGWPFTVSAVWLIWLTVLAGVAVWLIPTGVAATAAGFVVAVVSGWPGGVDGVMLVGLVFGAAAYIRWRFANTETDVFGLIKTVWRYAGRAMLVTNAVLVLNPVLVAAVFLSFWVGLTVDLVTGATSRRTALMRSYAEFRRELPDHWTDLAARSKRVQSIDVGLERTVSDAANERPILEHPGLGGLLDTRFDYDAFTAAVPVARLEGRSIEALEEVIDELAAQYFSVGDQVDAIRIVANDAVRSNFASWAWLEISFKPPDPRMGLTQIRDAFWALFHYSFLGFRRIR